MSWVILVPGGEKGERSPRRNAHPGVGYYGSSPGLFWLKRLNLRITYPPGPWLEVLLGRVSFVPLSSPLQHGPG